jgi:hypothetical protein
MTNSQPQPKKPSTKQMNYLEDLAEKTGGTFTFPHTSAQASAQIRLLKNRPVLTIAERRREALEARCQAGERHGDAAAVRDDEVAGWGSTATWS